MAVFTFPFLPSNCQPGPVNLEKQAGPVKKEAGPVKKEKKKNCSDKLRRGKVLTKRNQGNKVLRSGFNVCCRPQSKQSSFQATVQKHSKLLFSGFRQECHILHDHIRAGF
jgi:hypothetical protein